jgi:hypothetical protein
MTSKTGWPSSGERPGSGRVARAAAVAPPHRFEKEGRCPGDNPRSGLGFPAARKALAFRSGFTGPIQPDRPVSFG